MKGNGKQTPARAAGKPPERSIYDVIWRNEKGIMTMQKARRTYYEAYALFVNGNADEVVTRDENGYILETLNSK